MEKTDLQYRNFRELTSEEYQIHSGEGFAFDAGRFIRFMVISAGGAGINTAMAIGDFAMNATK